MTTTYHRVTRRLDAAQAVVVSDPYGGTAIVPDLTVFEDRSEWSDSGLLDADGTPLMRRTRHALGFIHHQDRDA
ncbi:hypothetical protein [uncultured Methylobacterium sp.]|uniref:hypothetical protein n=1 Tax=uncultured Methylobacterium sp. TaxID=157278 RepID=UPI0035CC5FE6